MPNVRPVFFIQGLIIIAIGVLMLVPTLVDFSINNDDWKVFATSAAVTIFSGGTLELSVLGEPVNLNLRQGFLLTTTTWVVVSAFSALPFIFSSLDAGITDAFFEALSGLTTTGATVFSGLDSLPPGILLWRSLLQWIGGIGIVVVAMAMLPFLRVGGMQLFRTESSDRADKVLPRTGQIAIAILLLYLSLTIVCAFFYWIEGMGGFDAINHAMTTVSTGGYSTHDASLGYFDLPAVHWTAVVFMILGSLPFAAYLHLIRGRGEAFFNNSQIRVFLSVLGVAAAAMTLWLFIADAVSFPDALRYATFHVVSIITTTGYATSDYTLWGSFAVGLLFLATFVGGCTGSTSGGLKIMRFEILARIGRKQMFGMVHPHGVDVPVYNRRAVTDEAARSVGLFVTQFLVLTAILTLTLALFGLDFETSLSGAATAIANVGPGLGPMIGPAGNFAALPDGAKWVLDFGMLLGRLEIVTVLVLFTRSFWRA